MITRNPETGKRNVGVYRMQVYDERTTGMHWQTQKHGAEHFRRARAANPEGRIDVAVAIGADPLTCLAGILPIPPDLDEMMFAGFLRREPVEMVSCETCELEVPAQAEIVLEGYVDLSEMRTEGPFGDHTGFYSLEGEYPVFHVTCVTHRRDPIYLTTIVGPPPQEDFFMGHAVERIFLPVMKMQYPGDRGRGHAGRGHLPQSDDCVHPQIVSGPRAQDHERDLVAGAGHVHQGGGGGGPRRERAGLPRSRLGRRSARSIPNATCNLSLGPADTLDHASRRQDFGSKMGIDATRKWPERRIRAPVAG